MTPLFRARAVGLGLSLVVAGSASAGSAPPCRVEASVEPTRVYVGQQVLYRARVYSQEEVGSVEWEHPPAFAHFRTENLPGDPRPGRADRDGASYRVRDEVRALFADRAGVFTLRAPELLCHVDGMRPRSVAVPDVEITVVPFPENARPVGFEGLVGTLSLLVTVTPREIALGESLRVAVMARGTGNLWDLPAPFSAADFAPAEVFARRPERAAERGRALFLRSHHVYDVVPREVGELLVPELTVPYFDPQEGRYRVARAEAVRVPVGPRAAVAPPASTEPARAASPAPPVDTDESSHGGLWVALPGLGMALLAGGLWWRRRGAGSRETARALARSAASAGDPEERASALARALRTALAEHLPDASSRTPEELLARADLAPEVGSAVRLLASLERSRFDPAGEPPDAGAVLRAIADLSGARESPTA